MRQPFGDSWCVVTNTISEQPKTILNFRFEKTLNITEKIMRVLPKSRERRIMAIRFLLVSFKHIYDSAAGPPPNICIECIECIFKAIRFLLISFKHMRSIIMEDLYLRFL